MTSSKTTKKADPEIQLGIVKAGGFTLGIPIKNLVEVTRVQNVFPVPTKNEATLGAINLRGTLIPLQCISTILGTPPQKDESTKLAAIIHAENKLLAIKVESVASLMSIASDATQAAFHIDCSKSGQPSQSMASNIDIVDAYFLHDNNHIAILSPENMVLTASTLKNPKAKDGINFSRKEGETQERNHRKAMLCFKAGGTTYALDAKSIQATVPRSKIEENALSSQLCLGSILYHKQRVPVMNTQKLTGLGTGRFKTLPEIIILRLSNAARVGLAVDNIEKMLTVQEKSTSFVPSALWDGEQLITRVFSSGEVEGQVFLICFQNLSKHVEIQRMAEVSNGEAIDSRKNSTKGKSSKDVVFESERYIILEEQGLIATPASRIFRIAASPTRIIPIKTTATRGLTGMFEFEDRCALHVDLSIYLKLPVSKLCKNNVLIVESGESIIGFAIASVKSVETSLWRKDALIETEEDDMAAFNLFGNVRILPILHLQNIADQILSMQ